MTPRPPDPLHPALTRWSSTWRLLLAAGVGALAYLGNAVDRLSRPEQDGLGAVLVLDLVLGLVSVALLTARRRHPLAVACAVVALLSVSAASFGAALLAIVSMATWRRRAWAVATGAVFVGCLLTVIALELPTQAPDQSRWELALGVGLGLLLYGAAVVTGYYIGARRELVVNLHERARAAEREQELLVETAREAERTRIAREMHDVLAHRISLVALHAGALTYCDGLTREQTAETAATIQANAQLALAELRQVLGVLRSGGDVEAVEPPQPSLAELPALLADSFEAGSPVTLDTDDLAAELDRLPPTLSRTAFRVVQEALTNARKHAPATPVRVVLDGAPGQALRITVSNPVGVGAGLVPSGVGLAGLSERAALAGGVLEHGADGQGAFVLRARLPWPA